MPSALDTLLDLLDLLDVLDVLDLLDAPDVPDVPDVLDVLDVLDTLDIAFAGKDWALTLCCFDSWLYSNPCLKVGVAGLMVSFARPCLLAV